jgi:hypothetical protein
MNRITELIKGIGPSSFGMDPGTIWIGIGAMVIVSTSTAISKLKTDCGTDYKVDKVGTL